MQQAGSEVALERGKAATDGRLREAQVPGRGREAATSDNGQEKAEIIPVQ